MLDNTLDYSPGSQDRPPASPVFRIRLKTGAPSPYDLFVGGTYSYRKEYSLDISPASFAFQLLLYLTTDISK